MKTAVFAALVWLAGSILPQVVQAADTLYLSPGMDGFNPSAYLYVLEYRDHTLNINELLGQKNRQRFYHNSSAVPNLGVTSSSYWFRLAVYTPTPQELSYYLSEDDPSHARVDYCQTHEYEVINQGLTGLLHETLHEPLAAEKPRAAQYPSQTQRNYLCLT